MSAEFKYTCPYCFQRISSEDDVSGQTVECPSCSHHFAATPDQIPSASVSNLPKVPPPPSPAQEKSRKDKAGTPCWLWPTVAGVASTIVVGGALFFALTDGNADPSKWDNHGVNSKSLINAANGGDPAAQLSLGIAYRDGNGVEEADPSEAFRWFQQSAEQGHAQAQLAVAVDYLDEKGGAPLDFKQGVLWLRRAEAQDNLDARANLGWCYANGFGVTKNLERAETLILDAAEKGNFLALSGMAQLHSGKVDGIEPDPEKYFYWTQKSAELGDQAGQYYMGCCFISGQGTPVDKENGWSWIERSAEQGFEPALAALQDRREQSAINEMQYRLQQQIERNMQQRPQGANPFSAHPSSQYVPPQFKEAEKRAYGEFR